MGVGRHTTTDDKRCSGSFLKRTMHLSNKDLGYSIFKLASERSFFIVRKFLYATKVAQRVEHCSLES